MSVPCRFCLPLCALAALACCPPIAQAQGDAIDETLPKIVKIFGAGGFTRLEAYGTGLIVSPAGHVMTVWNHLIDAGDVSVVLNDGRRLRATVVNGDPKRDVAVLKLEGADLGLPYFDLADSTDAPPGARVLAFSNMFKVATGDEAVSVLHGVVSVRTKLAARQGAFDSSYDGVVYILDAVTNNPGAAGGAVTTLDGRLVGMIGRELRNSESNAWVSYAVPVRDLRPVVEEIIAGKFTPTPSKASKKQVDGPTLADAGLILIPDVVYRTPAYVDGVRPGSVAAAAGFKPEDLIIFVNDRIVPSQRSLHENFSDLEAGETVRIVVRRNDLLVPIEFRVPEKSRKQGAADAR